MYEHFFKRLIDFMVSLLAIVILSPVLLLLTVIGAIAMQGNPFFVQPRPGRRKVIKQKDGTVTYGEEKIFNLIKFRSMTNAKDKKTGELLPDEKRLTRYGKFLRASSVDELPELFNILKGDMAIVGPRPLLVEYLPYYTEEERHRHDVRPGLTGFAQINGRNYISWEDRFKLDIEYVNNVTFPADINILVKTVITVIKHENIETGSSIEHNGVVYRPLNVERAEKQKRN